MKVVSLKEWLVDWLYTFHEAVNVIRGASSFDKTLLHDTYKGVDLKTIFESAKEVISKAKEIGGTGFLQWKQWVGMMHMLLTIHGV